MYKRYLFIIALLVSACTATPYNEPTTGPIAKVRFAIDNTPRIVEVGTYDNSMCEGDFDVWLRITSNIALDSSRINKLNIPLWEPQYDAGGAYEISVQANQIHHFQITGGVGLVCGAVFPFTFKEGKNYEVYFSNSRCEANIYEIVDSVPEPTKVKVESYDSSSNYTESCAKRFAD